jgi:low affinity Fe/Cu permease
MHDTVVKILKESNIILSDSKKSNNDMEVIIREVLKLQNKFVSLNSSSKWNLEDIIKTMKQQLEVSLGETIS